LRADVTAFISGNFSSQGGSCGSDSADWGISIGVVNDGEQFLLRFNTSSFHAVDDVGNEYQLIASGAGGNDKLGIDENYLISRKSNSFICTSWKGVPPLTAKYILLTADWISGVGPVTFRKDL
jgi:hypothetical protein